MAAPRPTCACGETAQFYCHTCGQGVCEQHALTWFLVVHCSMCWKRDHAREAARAADAAAGGTR